MAGTENVYLGSTIEALGDIGQMLRIAAGLQEPLVVTPGNTVSTKILLEKPETFMPLLVGFVVAFLYVKSIEATGRCVARLFGLKGKKVEKFADSFCEAFYFSVQIFLSYRLFSSSDWFWPSGWSTALDDGLKGDIAKGVGGLAPYQATREVRAYYVCEFGYYSVMLFAVFFKKRKKDFWEMVFHHIVTSTLIGFSYTLWHLRIGVVIMMIHNLFDPFLNIAKCAHYAFTGPAHIIADISFGVGAVCFLVTRLLYYPYAIYNCLLLAAPVEPHPSKTLQSTMIGLCCFLYPLHIFWFVLILKVAYKALFSGTVQGDERSDSEDEDDDDDAKKNE